MKALPLRHILLGLTLLGGVFVVGTILAFSLVQGRAATRLLRETEELAVESRGLGERADSLRAAVAQVQAYVGGETEDPGLSARSWVAEVEDQSISAATGLSGIPMEMRELLAEAADLESRVAGLLNQAMAQRAVGRMEEAARTLAEAESSAQALVSRLLSAQALGIDLLMTRQREAAAFSRWSLRLGLGWSLLGALLALSALAWLQTRFHRPLKELETGLARIGAGELDARVRVFRDDELGRLATILNTAAQGVRFRVEAQARAARGLSERLGRLLEDSNNEIFIFRDGDLQLVQINDAARTNLQLGEGDLRGMTPLDFLSLTEEELQECLDPLRQGQVRSVAADWEHRRADGTVYPVEGSLLFSAEEEPPVFLAVVRDVTVAREREERLRQAQKMEAVGQLTGGVAHDFNNLLTVIMGSLEMLDEALPEDHPARRNVADALQAAERGGALTYQLLAYSRRQALRPRILDLNQLLADMDRLLRRTIPESVEIETIRGAGLWRCEADPAQLQNAILNLALNARDAMPEGGKLTLETANARLDESYTRRHSDLSPGQYVMLAVTDTGRGMLPHVLAQAFEPFFTTKEVGQGSGLGLSMVYGFAKQSQGHVKLYSEESKGTTVKVYLPRIPASHGGQDDEKAGTDQEVPRGEGERILVVEDDDGVRELACTLLQDLGYRTADVRDAQEALAVLQEESPESFSLLFTDVVLPGGMTGKDLAEKVHEISPDMPVLFTSGYTENAIIHGGRLDPGVQLLEKPYRRDGLARRIWQVLHGSE